MTMRQLIQQIGSNDLQAIRVWSKMLSIMDSYASLLTEAIEFLAQFDCYEYRLTVVTSCCRTGVLQEWFEGLVCIARLSSAGLCIPGF